MDNNQKSDWDNLTEEDKRLLREFFDLLHKIDQRDPSLVRDLQDFAKMWNHNIRLQGFLEAMDISEG